MDGVYQTKRNKLKKNITTNNKINFQINPCRYIEIRKENVSCLEKPNSQMTKSLLCYNSDRHFN